jgi:two-component sensor histidine kinase/DNA-binding response OmpR family regulator
MTRRPPRIFLVEDEAVIGMELEDRLRGIGYDVCGRAVRAEQAIRDIPTAQPDVILVDVNLGPGPSGIDVVDRLRGLCDAPVLFLTAYADAQIVDHALETRSFGYVVKPFQLEALRASIEMALRLAAAERLLREQAVELRRSFALLHAAFDATADGVLVVDCAGAVVTANRRLYEMWRVPSDVDDGTAAGLLLSIEAQLSPERPEGVGLTGALEEGSSERLRHPDGRVFERRSHPQLLDGGAVGHVISFRDVTVREAAEEAEKERTRLLSEARHREQLFHELNHRVKNNLLTIMGMLRLECGDMPDPVFQGKLARILERIQAVVLVHDQLSVSAASNIEAAHFLRRLGCSVLAMHGREDSIRFEVEERAPFFLGPDDLMTMGMMVSELLVNAARHAFPAGRKGRLGLVLDACRGAPRIAVEDDGVGLPAVVDVTRSLGLRLVRSFAVRLGAELDFETPAGGGTRVVITLPAPAPRPGAPVMATA